MAEVTVFVDDAVCGTLPDVCAKDGVPASGRFRIEQEVGGSTRLGVLWLLVLAGPLGWIVLLLLSMRDTGERLTVALPYSVAAHDRYSAARRLRNVALAAGALGGLALLLLSTWAQLGAAGALLVGITVVATVVVAVVGEWRMGRAGVGVELDASRRWVTLTGVHPSFSAACRPARERVSHS